jgi:hypothetical protein
MSLKIFNSSRFDTLFYDNTEAITGRPCSVRIGGGQIEVSYEDEGVMVKYVGFEAGPGHFNLQAPEVEGKASLHMFEKGPHMDGFWVEGTLRGMWRVTLA